MSGHLTAQELATAEELSGSIWWQRAAAYQSSLYRVLTAYKALAAALAGKDARLAELERERPILCGEAHVWRTRATAAEARVAELEREIIHPDPALWDRLTRQP